MQRSYKYYDEALSNPCLILFHQETNQDGSEASEM